MRSRMNRAAAFLGIAAVYCVMGTSLGHAEGASWAYAGANGPAKWGKLDKAYATCATGELQAPIDIPDAEARKGDLSPILFNYKASPLRMVDDGHTIQVNYAPDSWITVAGKRYELISVDFHKPSEFKVSGKSYDMSANLVHKDKDGKVAIIAVLFDEGVENPLIKTLWTYLPLNRGKESVVDGVTVNATGLLPKAKEYYSFAGSLSAPPCTENVTWYVLRTPAHLSTEQIARFTRAYSMNARPVQPVNSRDIVGSR